MPVLSDGNDVTGKGGNRAGAGRPPFSLDGKVRVQRSLRLDPSTDATIAANRCAGESYASVVDRIVREWAAGQTTPTSPA